MKLHRLPGVRNGFAQHFSLWAAGDHILAVSGSRWRESYRRFYLADVQAIVITRCPRYGLSARAMALGAALLFSMLFPRAWQVALPLLVALIIAWWIISANYSCLCRIYTAVSSETLSSVYRTWTARRFLGEVEPLIAAAQAGLPVPPEGAAVRYAAPPGRAAGAAAARPAGPLPRRTLGSHLLLATVFTDAAATAIDLTRPAHSLDGLMLAILLAQVAAAVWVIVERSRRRIGQAGLWLAIAVLVFVGGAMYANSLLAAYQQVRAGKPAGLVTYARTDVIFRQIYIGGCLLLGLVGLAATLGPSSDEAR